MTRYDRPLGTRDARWATGFILFAAFMIADAIYCAASLYYN